MNRNGLPGGDFSIRCDTHSPILEVRQIARNLNAMVEELGTAETLREDFIAGGIP